MKTKRESTEVVEIHDSAGNVFEDLGMRDAQQRLAKAELARVIRRTIRNRGLTQSEVAKLFGVKQPDVSDLMRGKLSRFSMERLERFLNALDLEIRIQVGPRPRGKERRTRSLHRFSALCSMWPAIHCPYTARWRFTRRPRVPMVVNVGTPIV